MLPFPAAALPPADELALVRAEIARLRLREAALGACLRARPELCRQGRATRVEIEETVVSRLILSRLPQAIRDDPACRQTRKLVLLHCLPLPLPTAAPARHRAGRALN
jgi:hypothetical protein